MMLKQSRVALLLLVFVVAQAQHDSSKDVAPNEDLRLMYACLQYFTPEFLKYVACADRNVL